MIQKMSLNKHNMMGKYNDDYFWSAAAPDNLKSRAEAASTHEDGSHLLGNIIWPHVEAPASRNICSYTMKYFHF